MFRRFIGIVATLMKLIQESGLTMTHVKNPRMSSNMDITNQIRGEALLFCNLKGAIKINYTEKSRDPWDCVR